MPVSSKLSTLNWKNNPFLSLNAHLFMSSGEVTICSCDHKDFDTDNFYRNGDYPLPCYATSCWCTQTQYGCLLGKQICLFLIWNCGQNKFSMLCSWHCLRWSKLNRCTLEELGIGLCNLDKVPSGKLPPELINIGSADLVPPRVRQEKYWKYFTASAWWTE